MNPIKQYQWPIIILVTVAAVIRLGIMVILTKSELADVKSQYTPFDLDNVRSQARELVEKNKIIESDKVTIELQVKDLQTKRDKADEDQKVNTQKLDSLYNKSNMIQSILSGS